MGPQSPGKGLEFGIWDLGFGGWVSRVLVQGR